MKQINKKLDLTSGVLHFGATAFHFNETNLVLNWLDLMGGMSFIVEIVVNDIAVITINIANL